MSRQLRDTSVFRVLVKTNIDLGLEYQSSIADSQDKFYMLNVPAHSVEDALRTVKGQLDALRDVEVTDYLAGTRGYWIVSVNPVLGTRILLPLMCGKCRSKKYQK